MYFLYILKNNSGILYKGITNDTNRRLIEHNNDECVGTRGKGPWRLVYFEKHSNRDKARKREKFFKTGEGRELLHQILNIPL